MNRSESVCYCGREFKADELSHIRQLIHDNPGENRASLSRMVCEQLGWRRQDNRLKDMSCRVAMLRMERDGFIHLPPPANGNGNGKRYNRRTPATDPELFPEIKSAGELKDLCLEQVTGKKASLLWNEYIQRYHYLG